MLRGSHYAAVALSSSREAVERLRSEPFDALVTDLRMPGVDGLALLAQARRIAPELPVIVMTAYGSMQTAVSALKLDEK